jgi:integrase
MPKSLSNIQIKNIQKLGNHRVGDRLYISVEKNRKQWYIRPTVDGKRPWIYIGSYPRMSPTEAKQKAIELLSASVAPQVVIREAKQKFADSLVAEEGKQRTFQSVVEEYIRVKKLPEWKDEGKTQNQWEQSLRDYVYPVIGKKEIEAITEDHIMEILTPIWMEKHETAKRVRSRISAIIGYAQVKKYTDKKDPAQFKNFLEHLLPKWDGEVEHFAALPHDELPGFMSELWEKKEASYDALKLISLTQVRQRDAREALWKDFDLQDGHWMLPVRKGTTNRKIRMHKVPLPKKLLWFMQERRESSSGDRLFPNTEQTHKTKTGRSKFMSSQACDKSLDTFSRVDKENQRITMHGFRSTFVDWNAEHRHEDFIIGEMQLGHKLKDYTFASYMRSKLFERRRKLLQTYEDFAFSDMAFSSH